jgi:hypothetical protein
MPSVLETFFILFDSDASEVKKGAAEAKKVTDDLNKTLKSTDALSTKVGTSFSNLIGSAKGALLAFLSTGAIIGGIKAASTYANTLDEISKGLDVNIQDLSAWSDAVKLNGGSAEGFQQSLRGLSTSLSSFATKGKSALTPFFQELGVSMIDARGKARDVFDILPELADKFEKLGKQESFGIGQKLGLDQGTIFLLQRGRREVEDVIKKHKELGVVTKEDAEIAAKFNNTWDYTAILFRNLFTVANRTILPILTSVLEGIQGVVKYLRNHEGLIIGVITGIAVVLGAKLLPILIKTGAAAIAAFAPFFLAAAVIALIALLFEDIYGYYQGHNSVLGELIKKWPILGKIVKSIEWAIKETIKMFKELPKIIGAIWDELVSIVQTRIDQIKSFINSVIGAYEKVKSFITGIPDKVEANIISGQDLLNVASKNPISSQTSNSILSNSKTSNKTTNVQTGPITIETQATDANGIASELSNSLNTQMRQAVSNFDDGVIA